MLHPNGTTVSRETQFKKKICIYNIYPLYRVDSTHSLMVTEPVNQPVNTTVPSRAVPRRAKPRWASATRPKATCIELIRNRYFVPYFGDSPTAFHPAPTGPRGQRGCRRTIFETVEVGTLVIGPGLSITQLDASLQKGNEKQPLICDLMSANELINLFQLHVQFWWTVLFST